MQSKPTLHAPAYAAIVPIMGAYIVPTLYNWRIERSGDGLRIHGWTERNKPPTTVTGVKYVQFGTIGGLFAYNKDNKEIALLSKDIRAV